MKFSILIANYNNGKFIQDCFSSILKQTYQNFEVIIVDDASTDNSIDIINKLIEKDSRFKLYKSNVNSGCGYTKNRCADLATGDILAFVDPDDIIYANALEVMVKYHLENSNVGLIHSNHNRYDIGKDKPILVYGNQTLLNNNNFFNLNGEVSAFASFKRYTYIKTKGIDPYLKRAVDQDLYLKLYDVAKVLYIDETLYEYRMHRGGISSGDKGPGANFYHWIVIISAAKRRNVDIEKLFLSTFTDNKRLNTISKNINSLFNSRFIKIGKKLGFLKDFTKEKFKI